MAARRRGLTLGLLGQESHFDEAFMAAPDLRSAVRHGAAHLERMAEELGRLERDGHAGEAATPTSSTASTSSAATPSTSGSMRRCPGWDSRATSRTRPAAAISGGQQTRAALARLVIADPDLLLLDEPTDRLDIGAIEYVYMQVFGPGGRAVIPPRIAGAEDAARAARTHGAARLTGTGTALLARLPATTRRSAGHSRRAARARHRLGRPARHRGQGQCRPPKPLYLRAPDAQPQAAARLPRR